VTLILTSDDLESCRCESVIDLNKYHYLVCGCIEFDCERTYGWMDVQTLLPGLLGHLSGDDLIKTSAKANNGWCEICAGGNYCKSKSSVAHNPCHALHQL